MNWHSIEGTWREIRGGLVGIFGAATRDDASRSTNHPEELSGRIQKRYRLACDERNRKSKTWIADPGVLDDWNDRRAM